MENLSSPSIIQDGTKQKLVKVKPLTLEEDRPSLTRVVQYNYQARSKKMEQIGEGRISSTSTSRVPKKQKNIIPGQH